MQQRPKGCWHNLELCLKVHIAEWSKLKIELGE